VALDGDDIVGTAGLAPVGPCHEEVKSMRMHPDRRGHGIARRLLERVVADATRRGVARLSVETGAVDFFARARALYAANGFTPCPPFGTYCLDPNSTFMSRTL
jgi:putative acetyltransferase